MIASVTRVCQILNCFTPEEPVLGNAEIAERLGLSRSTTHHLITTLCKEGVLIKDLNRKYRLGWKLLEWNNSVMFQQDFYDRAMPLVKGLVEKFKGTSHIAMFDEGDVVNVLRISSDDPEFLPTYLGSRMPAYCTSAGKALLAYNESYLRKTIEKGLSRQGPNTIMDIKTLKRELESVREQGYSISNNENNTCTYAIAAPILSYSGETIASINLVGTTNYMRGVDHAFMIKSIVKMAKTLSRELGYIEM
ncbi:DNA-binding IclR family transcriptional regulator [Evansella vedderi]|uniref:DNA-binding IclR family transcriptional regulator n=1 Tax=Evansella vedderi TaxID=38282 RepID=A0ABU0A1H6_9BACI|nr:IclR family transcriptional regulator [Evansella vedderi]MDQ0257075.1 DNA-binding IclR family transcriptional regulator [Evansella vedderi]